MVTETIITNFGLLFVLITVIVNLIQFNIKIVNVVNRAEFQKLYDKIVNLLIEQEKLKTLLDEHVKKG